MPLQRGAYTIALCWHHGRALFKAGFCTQCVSKGNAEEADDVLEALATEELTVQLEAGNEVAHEEIYALQPTHLPLVS